MRLREPNPLAAFAHESITVAGTAIGATSATAFPSEAGAREAYVTIETAQVRFTTDGTTPTSTVGHLADPGTDIMLESPEEVRQFKAIRTGSTSATAKVTYFR